MEVKVKHLHIENFGIHRSLDFDLGRKITISGCNACGKSTVKRAVQWLLNCKNEDGKEVSGIRTHTEDGKEIDGLVSSVEATMLFDGEEHVLKKTYTQKKNRSGEITGENNTDFYIDGVRKTTRKSYDEFIQKYFPSSACMVSQEFLSKDTAGRRAMLEIFNKHDMESIIAENVEFEPLRAKLNANSTEDLKKTCREKIKTKTKERDAFPAKIEALNGQKEDIDVSELELLKNSLNEQIAENKEKQEDISKEFEEQQKASYGILELKFELNDLQIKANEDLEKQRRELKNEESDLCHRADREKSDIGYKKTQIHNRELHIKDLTADLEKAREEYTAKEKMEFDENDLTCKMCGRPYPEEKSVEIRMNFLNRKNDVLHEVAVRGNSIKDELQKEKDILEKSKKELETLEKGLEEKTERIEKVREKMRQLPDSIDISDHTEVQEIQRKIAEKEQAMNKGNSASEIRENLSCLESDLQSQLMEVNSKLALAKRNVEIDEQIADLRKQQLAKSQEIADVERELDLLKAFERKKAELLESDVNSWFDHVQVKMSEIQQNGEPKDVCLITVNGESYDRNLNHGSKMLAEIDICRAFQRKYGVVLPIILDDTESLNPWDIPDIENQIIMLRWSADKELKIEAEEQK